MAAPPTPEDVRHAAVKALKRALRRVESSEDDEAIHDARTLGRRAEALLMVLAQHSGADDVVDAHRALRRLRRALGAARDAEVVLARFVELGRQDRDPQVEAQLQQMVQDGLRQATRRARKRGRKVLRALGHVPMLEAPEGVVELRLARLAAQVMERARRLHQDPSWPHAHQLRIALRTLRYALDVVDVLQLPLAPTDIVRMTFKEAQDALGSAMDAHITAEHVAMLGGGNSALQQRLAARAQQDLQDVLVVVGVWVEQRGWMAP